MDLIHPHHIVVCSNGTYWIHRRTNYTEPYAVLCSVAGGYQEALSIMTALNNAGEGE